MYGAIIFSLPRKSRGRVKITGEGLVFHIDKKATLHNPEKDAKIRIRSVDMIIDLRYSNIDEIEFLITKKQLRKMLKERVYDLFGLEHGLGLKRYSNKEYMAAVQGTITFEADTLLDVLDDFAKADDDTQDIIASFFRYRILSQFGDDISVPFSLGFKEMLIFKLIKQAETDLIIGVVGYPPLEPNQKGLFGTNGG